jgi:hypothetical protein
MKSHVYPERGYRGCLGLIRLARRYGPERTERACLRAVQADACSYRSVNSILKTGLDRQALNPEVEIPVAGNHENVRGADYYRTEDTERSVACAE